MAAGTNRVAPLNMALAAIGVLLVAVGFVASSIAGAASSSALFPGVSMSSYPYFGIGVVTVILGMAFVASGLIYSPRKAEPIKQT
jgi:hypothetical protein